MDPEIHFAILYGEVTWGFSLPELGKSHGSF